MKTVPGPWMFWNALAAEDACVSLPTFIHPMRSKGF